jgi:type I restriction enzyme S subunit
MNAETFCEHFATFADAPNGIAKLRELILQLAVQGKLVPQDVNDEPASVLRLRIVAERQQQVNCGEFTVFATGTEWPDDALPHTLPNGWEWVRLGELGGFLGGGTPSKERPEFWNGKIPWVSPKDMKRPYMDDAIDHVTSLGVENSSGKMIHKGALLMVVRGMILAHSFPVALAMRELTINQDMKALQLALPELGEYLLRCSTACKSRMLESVERSSHGTCRLPTEAVANFPIPLPPLAEQRRIVEKVDQMLGLCDELAARQAAQREKRQRLVGATLDRLVSPHTSRHLACRGGLTASAPLDENTTGAKANEPPGQARWRVMQDDADRLRNHFDQLFDTPTTIPQLRQTILQLAVQGQLVPQDPNDEPASVLLTRISKDFSRAVKAKQMKNPKAIASPDSSFPYEVPCGWQWSQLGTLTAATDNAMCDGPFGSKLKTDHYVPQKGFAVIRLGNIGIGKFLWGKEGHITKEHYETLSSNHVDAGDLIVAGMADPIVRCCEVPAALGPAVNKADCFRLKVNSEMDRTYLMLYMNSSVARAFAEGNQQGMTRQRINLTNAKAMPVPVPPLAAQKRIVSKVTELLSLCDALEAKLTQAESASTQLLSAAVHHLLQH